MIKGRSENCILSRLPAAEYASLAPQLESITLKSRQKLEQPGKPISHVYFVERGIVSVVAVSPRRSSVEVGIVGWEGVTGLAAVLGAERSPNETFVQVAGAGRRIEVDPLRQVMPHSPTLQAFLCQYTHLFMMQVAHTALANGRANIEQRLARWLLMAQDRLLSPELPLTHEFLAVMLGVRRPSVTEALSLLVERGLLIVKRRAVVVLDRNGLQKAADGFYGVPESERVRLLGAPPED